MCYFVNLCDKLKYYKMKKASSFSLKTVFGNKRLITSILSVVILAVISLVYFYPDDVMGRVLQQHDMQQGFANGQEAKAFEAQTGETTRWTNSLFSGMPTFQISPSYQSTSLISWVNSVYGLGLPSPANLVFMMMFGFFLLMLSFRSKWYVALLGAIAYGFSSYFFIIIGAGHIWKFVTLAYVPPTIAGIVWAYRGKVLSGSAMAAFFAMMQIASNHVQMTYYFLFVVVAIVVAFLCIAIKEKKMKQWGIATGALAVAALLAVVANAPNLYSTYEYGKETMRGGKSELAEATANTTSGLDKTYITAWSYGIDETFTLMVPNVNGGATLKPEKGSNRFLSLADTKQAKDLAARGEISQEDYIYLQQFPQYHGNKPMTNGPVYVGALIVVLFLLGCIVVKGAMKWALLATTVLSIALAWGHNMMWLTDLMIDYFPLYNKFRTVESILVIAEFTMPLLAMLALQKIVAEKDFFAKHKLAMYASFGICAVICLFIYFVPNSFGAYSQVENEQFVQSGVSLQVPTLSRAIEQVRFEMISADAIRSFFVILLGFGALMLFFFKKAGEKTTIAIIAVVVLVDMYSINKRYLDTESFTEPLPSQATFVARNVDSQILADTTQNYRVLDQQHLEDAMPSYFHKHVGGYHAAKLMRYDDLLSYQIKRSNMEVLNMLNTKYVIANDSTCYINPHALGNAWFVDSLTYVETAKQEMNFLNDFNPATSAVADAKFKAVLAEAKPKAEGDTIFETTYAPNRLTYHANSKNGGVAVFSEIYFPWGWKATIDGKEAQIGRVNYVLRALNVPTGKHTIEFEFKPETVQATDTAASIAIILIYLLIIVALNVAVYNKMKGKPDAEV